MAFTATATAPLYKHAAPSRAIEKIDSFLSPFVAGFVVLIGFVACQVWNFYQILGWSEELSLTVAASGIITALLVTLSMFRRGPKATIASLATGITFDFIIGLIVALAYMGSHFCTYGTLL